MFTERIAAAGDGLQFVQNAEEDRSERRLLGGERFRQRHDVAIFVAAFLPLPNDVIPM